MAFERYRSTDKYTGPIQVSDNPRDGYWPEKALKSLGRVHQLVLNAQAADERARRLSASELAEASPGSVKSGSTELTDLIHVRVIREDNSPSQYDDEQIGELQKNPQLHIVNDGSA
jgi:hypothetical protein